MVSRRKTNKAILQVLTGSSEVLGRIQEDFHTMLKAREKEGHRSIEITCFYEELSHRMIGDVSMIFLLFSQRRVIRRAKSVSLLFKFTRASSKRFYEHRVTDFTVL